MRVLHVPKVTITLFGVPVAFQEEVLRQFEDDGEQDEQLIDDLVMDMLCKFLDNGPIIFDELRVLLGVCWGEFWYVVDLSILFLLLA